MGQELSQPVQLIHVERCGSHGFQVAVAEMQGWRFKHEDAHAFHCTENSIACWVLDGHSGECASRFTAAALQRRFSSKLNDGCLPSSAEITQEFLEIDNEWRAEASATGNLQAGTTVVGVLAVSDESGMYRVKLVNCGDSRGVIFRLSASSEALQETCDHKPSTSAECARIQAAGGVVRHHRVDGKLGVSRAFGNFEFKCDFMIPQDKQKVCCVPDVCELDAVPGGHMILLASDGLWNVVSTQEAIDMVCTAFAHNAHADLGDLAADLIRTSLTRDTHDNVTAMLIHLTHVKTWDVDTEEIQSFETLQHQDALRLLPLLKHHDFLARAGFDVASCKGLDCDNERWLLHDKDNHILGGSAPSGSRSRCIQRPRPDACGCCGLRKITRRLFVDAWRQLAHK